MKVKQELWDGEGVAQDAPDVLDCGYQDPDYVMEQYMRYVEICRKHGVIFLDHAGNWSK